jgi:FkbM family methyltransferase
MADDQKTLLDVVSYIVSRHPMLAPQVEQLAAYIQGKGYGAATVEHEFQMVQQLLDREPRLCIDIGGNVGEYTAEIRRKYPQAEIHVFEPSSTNVSQLTQRFSSDGRIKICPVAVTDKSGVATLFSNAAGSGLGSLTQRRLDHFNIDFNVKETINAIRFEDYWVHDLGEKIVDFVKIDVEGHEMAVLKGFGRAIHMSRIVQFEFGGTNIDTRTFFQDFWYFFKEHRFDLYRISPAGLRHMTGYHEADESFLTANFIAVNRSIS